MESLLTNFSEIHRYLSYLIIFFSIFVEGEIVLLLAGILSHRGYLNIFDTITIAFVATILHDLLYWSIGQKISQSSKQKIFCFNLEKIKRLLEKLKLRGGFYIFISKFAWSLNRIVLVTNGYQKMSAKKLLRYSVPASLIWSITFVSLGYVFAFETRLLKKDVASGTILLAIFIIAIVGLENLLKKVIEKKRAS